MKNYFLKYFLLFLSFTALVYGQSKTGTTIGQVLKIAPDTRVAALGNAGVSLHGSAATAFFNPASLGRLEKSSVQFTYSKWLADIQYNFGTAAIKVRSLGTLLLQVTALNSGEIDVRTVSQPLGTGELYSVTAFSMGLGIGRMLTDRVSVGMQLNYLRETIWHSSLADVSLNLGVQYQLFPQGPTLGASISNFGPRAAYNGRDLYLDYDFNPDKYGDNDQLPAELRTETFPLPTMFRVGFSVPFNLSESNRLLVAVDAIHPNDNGESLNVGGEWLLFENVALRGGYRNSFLQDAEGGLVLGAGLRFRLSGYTLHFDYAWADYGILKQTQRFSLGFGF